MFAIIPFVMLLSPGLSIRDPFAPLPLCLSLWLFRKHLFKQLEMLLSKLAKVLGADATIVSEAGGAR